MNDTTIKAHIIKEVCEYFDTSLFDLRCKSSKRVYVLPRQFIMYYCKIFTKMKWNEIGLIFLQDHATAIHAFNTINALITYNGYAVKDREISKRIKNVILTGTGAKRRMYHYHALPVKVKHWRKFINNACKAR